MQTTLDALEKALASIEHIGREESTFDVDGVKVTLRVMLPEEENDVQRYASKALPAPLGDDDGEKKIQGVDQLDYIERFKIAVLSHALVQVGDADFRDLKYVETGETLENGTKVRILKHDAIRKFLHKWSGALRTRMFQKYAELLARMEKHAENAIQFEPADVATEIERLEKRLEKLRKSESHKQTVQSTLTSQVQSIAEMEQPFAKAGEAPPDVSEPEPDDQEEAPTPPPPRVRQPITPPKVEAPAPPRQPAQTVARSPEPVPEEALPPQKAGTMVPPEMPDSFVDMSDTDGLRAAMAAEENRILEQRRRRAAEVQPVPVTQDALEGPVDRTQIRRPPHADIAAMEDAEKFTAAGTLNGIPAYRLPPEPLTRSREQQGTVEPPPINQSKPVAQSRNPRFKSPTGR